MTGSRERERERGKTSVEGLIYTSSYIRNSSSSSDSLESITRGYQTLSDGVYDAGKGDSSLPGPASTTGHHHVLKLVPLTSGAIMRPTTC